MITNTLKTVLVDGVSAVTPMYRRNETETVKSKFYIANGSQKGLGAVGFYYEDDITAYIVSKIELHETSVYNISGTSTPANTTVYLSSGFVKGSIEAIKNNIVAVTYADSEGNFSFSNVRDSSGQITLWICTFAEEASTANLEYKLSLVDYNPNIGQLLTYSFMEPEGQYKNPRFIISGTCSEDIKKVYLSRVEDTMDVGFLTAAGALCESTIPADDGYFVIRHSGYYDENYVIWAIAKSDGSFIVDDISIEVEEDTSTCLSGDTLITMADGSQRRMDSLCVGDIVLSRNGIHSRIHSAKRNRFSDYHTRYYFEDGTVIDETHPHRFYNVDQGFWQRLQLWNIGDHAINQDGIEVALVSVERLDEEAEMFGIWTDDGTYYANGLLSGAAFCNKELLAEATAEQAVDMMLSVDESWLLELMGLEGELPL